MKKIFLISITLLLVLTGCNSTKRLQDGQYLVHKLKIKSKHVNVSKESLMNVVKQRPNRKIILLGRFHLHMYNIPNPDKMEVARQKKNQRRHQRSLKRLAKGKKDTLRYKLTAAEWFRQVVGEPPVILDTMLAQESKDQLSLFLMKKGYFKNEVQFHYKKWDHWPRKHKAKLYYTITVQDPYRIDSISYDIRDPNISQIFNSKLPESLIKKGDQFDVGVLDNERDRITNDLRNDGYYSFVKEYIEFEVDTINKKDKVGLKMTIFNPSNNTAGSNEDHVSYSIGEVYIDYQIPGVSVLEKDTLVTADYTFVGTSFFPLNPSLLSKNVFINKGDKYQKNKVVNTYQRLLAIEVISLVNIQFIEDQLDSEVLNVIIHVSFNKRVSSALETTGTTNSGDNLGLKLSALFKHKNIFHGAEVLKLQLQAGIESQTLITEDETGTTEANRFNLNTLEFGPKLSLKFPKLLWPLHILGTSKSTNQSTIISTAYNFQSRADYKRSLILASLGFNLRETHRTKLGFNLLEMNVIKMDKSQSFIDRLQEINDRFLSDSYSDHFILATNFTLIKKRRRISTSRSSFYNKSNLEFAGNLLRMLAPSLDLAQNEGGSYEVLGIPFAQYSKFSNDLRLYHKFNKNSSIAYRVFSGIGVPFDNIDVLPFSRSFYGGGANGNRAWKARSLGPGSYSELVTNFDKIGDIHLETNMEYRFNLINYLEGAFFIDAGNIWLFNEDPIRVGGQFDPKTFLSEVAIGFGVGARLNFDYFLVRFDLAMQAKDPSMVGGERWMFQNKEEYNTRIDTYNAAALEGQDILNHYRPKINFNLGIGYPF